MASQYSTQKHLEAGGRGGGRSSAVKEYSAVSTLPSVTRSTPIHSQDSYETQWLENNTTNSIVSTYDDSNKDYYVKYQTDSRFRNFVRDLLRSSTGGILKSNNSDTVIKSKSNMSMTGGKFQDMVKDKWGEKRSLDESEIGSGRDVQVRK